MKMIFPEKKRYIHSWKLFFIISLIGILSAGCDADVPSHGGKPASRSFTGDRFTYEDLEIERNFHVVATEHPTCSFVLEFLDREQIKTPNWTYQYVIDENGKIHIIDPSDSLRDLATLEIGPQNAENPEFISVIHIFTDRKAAEDSGMWVGELPSHGPYRYEAGWYRARVQVGYRPYDIVLVSKENADYLYVTNALENTVSVIRASDNTVIKTIRVGRNPKRLAVAPDGSHVYVVNTEDGEYGTVSVLRTFDHSNIKTISVGIRPYGVTVSPDGSYVYITETHENLIRVIRTSDHTVLGTMPLSQDSLEYAEVYFGDLINGSNYSIIAIDGECGPLSKVPDMTDPICKKNRYSADCPLKCPSTVGKIIAVIENVKPDENGYWFSGFLNNRFPNGTITLLLVENFTGAEGQDLDREDNSILDYEESPETVPPWQNIVDEISVKNYTTEGRCYSNTVIQIIAPYGLPPINGRLEITGSHSRIPNGMDTDSADDWARNNNYSSWLHSVYTGSDIFHLINIPETDKAYNSPGEQNQLYGQAAVTIKTNHPVINEFLLNRGEYRPLSLTAPREAFAGNYFYLSTEENIILRVLVPDHIVLERIDVGLQGMEISNTTEMTIVPGGALYLVDEKNFSVAVIREGSVIKRIPVNFTPFGISSSVDGRYVFVTSLQTNLLTVIRTSDDSITEVLPLRDESTGIEVSRSGNYLYVTNENENTVSIVTYSDGSVCN